MSGDAALDPARDPFHADFSSSPEHKELLAQLQRNHDEKSIKLGPSMAFHNHAAALLTSAYRLGATSTELAAILDTTPELSGLQPASAGKQADLTITRDNWEAHLGGHGLFGLGAHRTFPAYADFFEREVADLGATATIDKYFPRLAAGAVGDFFHAVIEFGYYFESRSPALLPAGLAWLAASFFEIPALETCAASARPPEEVFDSPVDALAALSRDPRPFPEFELADGSSGYIAAMEDLVSEHGDAVFRYDLAALPDDSEISRLDRLRAMTCAGANSFAAGGAVDFFTLHMVTGCRAAWAILQGARLPIGVQDKLLEALWRAMLLTHVARNRPWPPPDAIPGRPWKEIVRAGRTSQNSHIAKVVMNCADFWDKWGNDLFWRTAEATVAAREAGARLNGTGVGSKMDRFVKASDP